jgi:hypothetical protein
MATTTTTTTTPTPAIAAPVAIEDKKLNELREDIKTSTQTKMYLEELLRARLNTVRMRKVNFNTLEPSKHEIPNASDIVKEQYIVDTNKTMKCILKSLVTTDFKSDQVNLPNRGMIEMIMDLNSKIGYSAHPVKDSLAVRRFVPIPLESASNRYMRFLADRLNGGQGLLTDTQYYHYVIIEYKRRDDGGNDDALTDLEKRYYKKLVVGLNSSLPLDVQAEHQRQLDVLMREYNAQIEKDAEIARNQMDEIELAEDAEIAGGGADGDDDDDDEEEAAGAASVAPARRSTRPAIGGATMARLTTEIEKLERSIGTQNTYVSSRVVKLNEYMRENKINEMLATMKRLRVEIAADKRTLGSRRSAVALDKTKRAKLTERMNTNQAQLDALEKAYETHRSSIERYRSEIADGESALADYKDNLTFFRAALVDMQQKTLNDIELRHDADKTALNEITKLRESFGNLLLAGAVAGVVAERAKLRADLVGKVTSLYDSIESNLYPVLDQIESTCADKVMRIHGDLQQFAVYVNALGVSDDAKKQNLAGVDDILASTTACISAADELKRIKTRLDDSRMADYTGLSDDGLNNMLNNEIIPAFTEMIRAEDRHATINSYLDAYAGAITKYQDLLRKQAYYVLVYQASKIRKKITENKFTRIVPNAAYLIDYLCSTDDTAYTADDLKTKILNRLVNVVDTVAALTATITDDEIRDLGEFIFFVQQVLHLEVADVRVGVRYLVLRRLEIIQDAAKEHMSKSTHPHVKWLVMLRVLPTELSVMSAISTDSFLYKKFSSLVDLIYDRVNAFDVDDDDDKAYEFIRNGFDDWKELVDAICDVFLREKGLLSRKLVPKRLHDLYNITNKIYADIAALLSGQPDNVKQKVQAFAEFNDDILYDAYLQLTGRCLYWNWEKTLANLKTRKTFWQALVAKTPSASEKARIEILDRLDEYLQYYLKTTPGLAGVRKNVVDAFAASTGKLFSKREVDEIVVMLNKIKDDFAVKSDPDSFSDIILLLNARIDPGMTSSSGKSRGGAEDSDDSDGWDTGDERVEMYPFTTSGARGAATTTTATSVAPGDTKSIAGGGGGGDGINDGQDMITLFGYTGRLLEMMSDVTGDRDGYRDMPVIHTAEDAATLFIPAPTMMQRLRAMDEMLREMYSSMLRPTNFKDRLLTPELFVYGRDDEVICGLGYVKKVFIGIERVINEFEADLNRINPRIVSTLRDYLKLREIPTDNFDGQMELVIPVFKYLFEEMRIYYLNEDADKGNTFSRLLNVMGTGKYAVRWYDDELDPLHRGVGEKDSPDTSDVDSAHPQKLKGNEWFWAPGQQEFGKELVEMFTDRGLHQEYELLVHPMISNEPVAGGDVFESTSFDTARAVKAVRMIIENAIYYRNQYREFRDTTAPLVRDGQILRAMEREGLYKDLHDMRANIEKRLDKTDAESRKSSDSIGKIVRNAYDASIESLRTLSNSGVVLPIGSIGGGAPLTRSPTAHTPVVGVSDDVKTKIDALLGRPAESPYTLCNECVAGVVSTIMTKLASSGHCALLACPGHTEEILAAEAMFKDLAYFKEKNMTYTIFAFWT